jgi:hypothetical protein
VTATLATFFVGRDAESGDAELAGAGSIEALHTEVTALRAEVSALTLELREQRRGTPDSKARAPQREGQRDASGTPARETRTRRSR